MKKKNQIIISCIFAVVAVSILYSFLTKETQEKGEEVYLFADDYISGTLISPDMVKKAKLSSEGLSPEGFATEEEIIGKYTTANVNTGQIVLNEGITDFPDKIRHYDIAFGNVVYTLALRPEDVNGWWIYKGSYINVLFYSSQNIGSHTTEVYADENHFGSVEIIENIKVVKILDSSGADFDPSKNIAHIICLELSKEQAAKMLIAENSKKIKILPGQ